jgi:hypothetical protein
MRCNPPPFTAIYAILDAIGFNHFTLTVSKPVRTLFSANWSFRFHYGVFFAIVIHGAGTPSGWGTGSSWRHSLAARRQGFVKKEGNAEKRLNRLLNKNTTNTETCMQKRAKQSLTRDQRARRPRSSSFVELSLWVKRNSEISL